MIVKGFYPNGVKAFSSVNLRGLMDYSRRFRCTGVELGMGIDMDGLYKVTWVNGVVASGSFADPSVMLGWFLNRSWCDAIECERHTFNQGAAAPGRLQLPRLASLDRHGTKQRLGPWVYHAYRDATHTAMVRFIRD